MAAITRLHRPLLSSFKSSSSFIIRFPSSTLYSPRRLHSLCSNAQAQVSTAEANGSIVGETSLGLTFMLPALSDKINCNVDDIVIIELNVCDTQPSCLGVFSGRLDNLALSYCALRALIDSCNSPGDLASEYAIRMVALFDNEEVGSGSIQGAGAPTMFQVMRRIISCLAEKYVGEGSFERAIRQSFLVSATETMVKGTREVLDLVGSGRWGSFITTIQEYLKSNIKGLVR